MGSLKNFFRHNKKILKTEKKDTKVLIADRCRFFDSIIYSVLGAAFCNKKNLNALVIFNKKNFVYKQIFKSKNFNKKIILIISKIKRDFKITLKKILKNLKSSFGLRYE